MTVVTNDRCQDRSASTTVRESTADNRLAMHKPITMLINAAQILPSTLPPKANGNTIVATVTRANDPAKEHSRSRCDHRKQVSEAGRRQSRHERRYGIVQGERI